MFQRLTTWRFGVLVGLALLDALLFVVPVIPLALVAAAIVAPESLRRAARFLDSLADGR